MKKMTRYAARNLREFEKQEDGTATVESVIWFPIYLLILGLIFDVTMLMMGQTEIWTVANDTSRMVALGRMTESEAETYVTTNMGFVVDVTSDGNIVTTRIERPFGEVASLGIINSATANLIAESHYRIEPSS